MARPSQYSRGRRIVMQATMLAVFLATLGLAALVGSHRDRAAALELSDEPTPVGRLAIRLPKGWELGKHSTGLPVTVKLSKRGRSPSAERLPAVIHQTPTTGESAEQLLANYLSKFPGEVGPIRALRVLDNAGAVARFVRYHEIENDPEGRSVPIPGWYAATVIPGAAGNGRDLGVVIGVEGYETDGPAGVRLIRRLSEGISVQSE